MSRLIRLHLFGLLVVQSILGEVVCVFPEQTVTLDAKLNLRIPANYQWFENQVPIPKATSAQLKLVAGAEYSSSILQVEVSTELGKAVSEPITIRVLPDFPHSADPSAKRQSAFFSNLSVRSVTGHNNQTLVVGLTREGTKECPLLIRCAGPSLARFGVEGYLADPTVEIYTSGILAASNDDWPVRGMHTTLSGLFNKLGAFPFDVEHLLDAALLNFLDGQSTIMVRDYKPNTRGIVLFEAYDLGLSETSRLSNFSIQNYAGIGNESLILGFSVSGSGKLRVLIRGIGPGLTPFGVPGTMVDPELTLYQHTNSGDKLISHNDDWGLENKETFDRTGAFGLPAGSKDAAIVLSLPSGNYSAILNAKSSRTGRAMVEIYEVKDTP